MKPILFIMCVLFWGASQNKMLSPKWDDSDYFEVVNELTPIVYDSVPSNTSFLIHAIYCGPRIEDRKLPDNATFVKPLEIFNKKVDKNTNPLYPSDLYWVHYLNPQIIQINYGLYCLPRIIYRGNPPPDTRPRPFMNISFDCAIKTWQIIYSKPYSKSYKSSIKTVYTTTYPFIPQNTSHQIAKWNYKSIIKIFKNGNLYREYEVSDRIPDISKVHSYVLNTEPTLVVEILE